MKKSFLILILGIIVSTGYNFAERWPMGPGNEVQPIGNYYAQFLDFSSPYYHDGLDLMGSGGDSVYSVSDGFIREIVVSDPNYSGLFITSNSTGQDLGWCYYHITSTTMPFIEGDEVHVDDYLGDISTWHTADFHHLHFTRCRYPGNNSAWYDAVANPIEFLVPSAEPDAPVFQEAQTGQMFSFVENNSNTQIDPSSVYGQVDIIARISDRILDDTWVVIPYQIEWWVENTDEIVVVPIKVFVVHTGDCFDDTTVTSVVYKDSGIWDTEADYDAADRNFYFIISNTDSDGEAELSDSIFAFYSNSLANGDYSLYVRATDWAGNSTTESMNFTVNNTTGENSIDIVHVLDRSGSMGGYTSETSTDRKIEVLRYAADEFVQMMKPDIENRIGIVQFNQDVVSFSPPEPNLQELTSTNVSDMRDAIDSIVRGGTTSIGDGLNEALTQLDGISDPNPLQAILLISDGKENTPLWIADVQPNLIGNNIKVYSLGLGYSSGIDEEKLTDLAEATGGDYRITSDDLEFRKFFLEVLADAANWEVITDPIQILTSQPTFISVPVTDYDRKVIFTAYWEGQRADNALSLLLITPSGKIITSSTSSNKINYFEHPRYSFYCVEFPLSGELSGDHQGIWKMKLVKNPNAGNIRYAISAFSDSAVEFDVQFINQSNLTGEKINVTGRLTKGGIPIPGLGIDIFCDVPLVGAGNVLYDPDIGIEDLDPDMIVNGDPVSLIDQKITLLSKRNKKNVLIRGKTQLKLYDDGMHQDGNANDGIYANSFSSTRIPGSYTFRFVASDIPSGNGQTTTREWTKSFSNKVNIDPDYSIIQIDSVSGESDQVIKRVRVVPRDRFGNYLGPGHYVTAIIWYAGNGREIVLKDNIDGTYVRDIVLTQEEVMENATVLIEVDKKPFNPQKPLLKRRWIISFHGGYNFPINTFGQDYNSGLSVYADFGFKITPELAVVINAGYNAFKAQNTSYDDTYWINLSGNIKYRLRLSNPISILFCAGSGFYYPKSGDSKLGVNAGIAVEYAINNKVSFEMGGDHHIIFDGVKAYDSTKSGNIQFELIRIGVIFHF